MNPVTLLDAGLCRQLVAALGHSLWMGGLLVLAAACATSCMKKRPARARYALWCAALIGLALCPVASFFLIGNSPDSSVSPTPDMRTVQVADAASGSPVDEDDVSVGPAGATTEAKRAEEERVRAATLPEETPATAPARPEYPAVLASIYFLGVAVMLVRLLLSLYGGRRLRKRSHPVGEADILAALSRQAQALGMAFTPAIAYCERVLAPTVVGVIRPAVLLPIAFGSGLTPQQVAMVLTHELAHIRRYDYLVNILQRVAEALMFYHPCVWLVSVRIRVERENCCDDLVLSPGGDPGAYAEALVVLAELSCTRRRPGLADAAAVGAVSRPSHLRLRILRFLDGRAHTPVRLARGWVVFVAVMVGGALGAVSLLHAEPAPGAVAEAAEPAATTGNELSETSGQEAEIAEKAQEYLVQLKDEDWWLRKVAVQQLGTMFEDGRNKDAVNARHHAGFYRLVLDGMIQALKDEESRVREAAATALGEVGDEDAIKHLAAALKDDSVNVKRAAAKALAKFDPAQVMPLLRLAVADSYLPMQLGAIAALGEVGTDECVAMLIDAFARSIPPRPRANGPEIDLYRAISNALAVMPPDKVVGPLTEGLYSSNANVSIGCADVLGRLGNERAVAALMAFAGTSGTHSEARQRAIEALGNVTVEGVEAALRHALDDPAYEVRKTAAEALLKRGYNPSERDEQAAFQVALGNFGVAAGYGSTALPHLLLALESSTDDNVRRDLVKTLGALGDEGAIDTLTDVLRDIDREGAGRGGPPPVVEYARREAVSALSRIGGPNAVPPLILALNDPNPEVRAASVIVLGEMGDPRAVEPLGRTSKDQEQAIRAYSAIALGNLGDKRAVEPLLAALRDISDGVRKNAADSLGKLGDARAMAGLTGALDDPEREVRLRAARALGQIGDPRAIDGLAMALQDEEPMVQQVAALSLGQIGDRAAVEPLLQAFKMGDASCDPQIAEALGQLGDLRAVEPLLAYSQSCIGPALQGANVSVEAPVQALARLGDDRAVEPFAQLAAKAPRRTHWFEAIKALETIGSGAAKTALEEVQTSGDLSRRVEAQQALERLNARTGGAAE